LKKISMYSKTSVLSSALVGQQRLWMSSFFSVAKKLSATATAPASRGVVAVLVEPAVPVSRR
jgi:hypothetical protein